jgi:predicted TIM-barrel fold metal-dependent hydrolase
VLAAAGLSHEAITADPMAFSEMRPGCYEPKARLADMDLNDTEASLCFPTFPRFCGQTFHEARDKDLAAACVHAYNDWMIEEWCGDSGGRLIPLSLIPLWDPPAAAAEVRRNAARGCRAVAFSELPPALGLPSIHDAAGYWTPFFEACNETSSVICMHIGSSSAFTNSSPDAPPGVAVALTTINAQVAMTDWLLSGLLVRYPNIRLAFSESQIGWMPFLLERLDKIFHRGVAYSAVREALPNPPSSYIAGRVYGCFFDDDFGLASHEYIGIDQITFETDYPHQDSTWPNSARIVDGFASKLSEEDLRKVLRDNACTMLGLAQ